MGCKSSKPVYDEKLKEKLKKIFEEADDGWFPDKHLDQEEMLVVLTKTQLLETIEGPIKDKMDSNNDKFITMDELMAAVDKNKDGVVSLEEFLSLARKPQYNETLKKKIMAMFIDGDRKIDRSLTPVELTMKMIPDQITELIKGTEIDKKFDKNADGRISLKELIAGLDTDGDGNISLEEFLKVAIEK
eukprot:m.229459 g.229459  ORF g.229459 m.229459 type:complete len:188 (-) comp15988_c0_seq29:1158-1721(-)